MTPYFPSLDSAALENAWTSLSDQVARSRALPLTSILASEPERTKHLVISAAELRIDFSRQRLPATALPTLASLANQACLTAWRDAMFRGEWVNSSERRPALHTALRDPDARLTPSLDSEVSATVRNTLTRMREVSEQVRSGQWRGATGRPISDILHVGIGGSQLGPELACEALHQFAHPRLRVHFLGNIDPDRWARLSLDLNPLTTLVIVASKSWRTPETARNAQAVQQWLLDGGVASNALGGHLVAVSSNLDAARSLGVDAHNIFPCPDWVGGRYSLWGAVGLPIMLQIGADAFEAMLAGALAMDRHFTTAPCLENAPMMLALISAWNASLLQSGTEAVIPYSDALRRFAAHLQQLQMESNGKSVTALGQPVGRPTMPVVWGEPGTDSQHSFFQALHQGVAVHPVDMVIVGGAADSDPWLRARALRANAVAQAQALSLGHDDGDPQRVHPGGRPVTLIHLSRLDPAGLGALIALYEHKTACLGWLWGLNPFDQWGVELGKRLAVDMETRLGALSPEAAIGADLPEIDAATRSTLDYFRSR
jgi:glucose-6-phosphate isomerase